MFRLDIQTAYTDSPAAGPKDPERVPTVQVLDDLAKEITTCWQSIGRHLGVSQRTIESISMSVQHIRPEHKAFEMLNAWRDQGESSSTHRRLAEALRHVHKDRLAEKYCEADKNEGRTQLSYALLDL